MRSASTTSMAAGRSKLVCSARVALTTTTLIGASGAAAAARGAAANSAATKFKR